MPDPKPRTPSGHWLRIDHIVIDNYAAEIGAIGIGVYAALARFADFRHRTCHPSYDTLARMLSLSRRHVIRVVRQLADLGLISIKRSPPTTGRRRRSNTYTLLAIQEELPLSTNSCTTIPDM